MMMTTMTMHTRFVRVPRCPRPVLAGVGAVPSSLDSSTITPSDRQHIRRALELARTAEGQTFPNPLVGCVITDVEGNVVGEGFHPKAGMPHAEVYALRAAGQKAARGTAYVTLEPCNHFGRTPPCSRALVAANISRVVVGIVDPNPLVGGFGIQTLIDAGIAVDRVGGEEEQMCFDINKDFMARMQEEAKKAAASIQTRSCCDCADD